LEPGKFINDEIKIERNFIMKNNLEKFFEFDSNNHLNHDNQLTHYKYPICKRENLILTYPDRCYTSIRQVTPTIADVTELYEFYSKDSEPMSASCKDCNEQIDGDEIIQI
jgi:hypothetical protein